MSPAHSPESIDLDNQESSRIAIIVPPPDPDARGGSGTLRKAVVLLVILSTVGFVAWKIHGNLDFSDPAGSGKKQPAGRDRAVPVMTAAVQQKTMPIYVTALGTATAYYLVTIKSRVDGQLTAVTVREGQRIKRGQLVAQIDPAPYAAALAQAEGQLGKDKAADSFARKEAERYTALFNAGVVSQETQQSLVASAGQIAGAIQADQAAIQAAKVSLDYTRITSPIDGVVGLRQVDPGNIVHASDVTGLLLVTQLQPISVIFTLPEDQLPEVRRSFVEGKMLAVEAYDRSQTTLLATGKLLTLDNQIDTATGTDRAKAIFDNKDGALFPNQFVNVRLILQRRPDTIVIPAAAVQMGSQGNFVYVVKKGDPLNPDASDTKTARNAAGSEHTHADKPAATPAAEGAGAGDKAADKSAGQAKFYVELRPIVVDLTEGSQVIVSSGLAADEQVVIDGMEKLKNGSRVAPARDVAKSSRSSSRAGDSSADSPPSGPDPKAAAAADGTSREHHHHGPQP